MSDRAALLKAIIANPDEDTPRLVYADWLDEHGEEQRAAFIRGQIEYHRLTTADTVTNALGALWEGYNPATERVNWAPVDADLAARIAARKANEKLRFRMNEKTEGLPRVKGARYTGEERGFLDTVTVKDPEPFLAHADAVFRSAPITRVHFTELTGAQAEKFVASGHLAQVRVLMFGYAVEPDALRVFGAHADAVGVRELSIGGDEAAATVDALAAGKHWTGLEFLDVSGIQESDDPPGEEQMARLFARPQFRNLRVLNAWGACVDDAVAKSIARNLPELRELDLSMNDLADVRSIAAAKNLRNLRELDLSSCDLEGDPAPLLTAPNLPNLIVLRLDSNHELDGPNPKALAKPGRGPGLRVLDLGHVTLTEESVEALAKCPALRGLWYLGLGYAGLGDAHLERFTRHAAFERLTCLELNSNNITARGAKVLAAWPGAANLQWLNLTLNSVGESGAKALAASPHLTGLKCISANGRGATLLKKRFKKAFL